MGGRDLGLGNDRNKEWGRPLARLDSRVRRSATPEGLAWCFWCAAAAQLLRRSGWAGTSGELWYFGSGGCSSGAV